ncbi:hypothetical protein ABPG74_004865 [Tetrahymena malaccensis]
MVEGYQACEKFFENDEKQLVLECCMLIGLHSKGRSYKDISQLISIITGQVSKIFHRFNQLSDILIDMRVSNSKPTSKRLRVYQQRLYPFHTVKQFYLQYYSYSIHTTDPSPNPKPNSTGCPLSRSCFNKQFLIIQLMKKVLNSRINTKAANDLGICLAQCQNITNLSLYLEYNQISEQGPSDLCFPLISCQNLKILQISFDGNAIGDEGMKGLASAITNLVNLVEFLLDVIGNSIEDDGLNELCQSLTSCVKLQNLTIYLDNNRIEASGESNFCSILNNLISLKTLQIQLDQNQFDEEKEQTLMSHIKKMKRLVKQQILI